MLRVFTKKQQKTELSKALNHIHMLHIAVYLQSDKIGLEMEEII